jgi:YfiH family protein
LNAALPAPAHYLQQVHGNRVVRHPAAEFSTSAPAIEADAQWSDRRHEVCAVLTADCLPVLFCDRQGTQVAAAHAGWRGLAAGVLENTIATFKAPASDVLAWLGPAIGPTAYQVGGDVKAAFELQQSEGGAFAPDGQRWLFDLYAMARHCLQRAGVGHISGGGFCTFSDEQRFFSYRRDGVTGRMASLVWLRST